MSHRFFPACARRLFSGRYLSSLTPLLGLLLALPQLAAQPVFSRRYEVVVVGSSSAAVVAGIRLARAGRDVVLLPGEEPLGGLSVAGLGATDVGHERAIGGLAREFYRRIGAVYAEEDSWRFERPGDAVAARYGRAADGAWFRFSPSIAQRVFREWIAEAGLVVLEGEHFEPAKSAQVLRARGGRALPRLRAIATTGGRWLQAHHWIDATYEGDLLAVAGCTHVVGRESAERYGESLAGVQRERALAHQFQHPVDPWIRPGDPSSGLLPGIDARAPEGEGQGDRAVQAYNLRLCLTAVPENRLPFTKPEGYEEQDYELLFRHFEAGSTLAPWHSLAVPNGKTDTNNNGAVSSDFIGRSWAWPRASREERPRMAAEHLRWVQGLWWSLANHPRVPEEVRNQASRLGLCRDEFVENGGWPPAVYVREGRRLVGRVVVTEHEALGRRPVEEPIALAAYTLDSHHVRRYVDASGHVRNEGDVQVPLPEPFGIPFGAIAPRRDECRNLLVPVACSASHVAFGSLRMEPVFMALGAAAATAVDLALAAGDGVEAADIPYEQLAAVLRKEGQRMRWERPPPPPGAVTIASLAREGAQIADDAEASSERAWTPSTSERPFVGRGYRHDGAAGAAGTPLRFVLRAQRSGAHALAFTWPAHANRAPDARVRIERRGQLVRELVLDQRERPQVRLPQAALGWRFLARVDLARGEELHVQLQSGGRGYCVADALRLLPLVRPR